MPVARVSASIGFGILRRFDLTFDDARQRIVLAPNHLSGERDVFNRAGFRLQRQAGVWTLSTVYPHSPAAEAGLTVRTAVSALDGTSIDVLGPDGIWSKLLGPDGSRLIVTTSTPGGSRDVALTLHDLL